MIDHEQLRQQYNPDGSQLRRQQLRMLDILIEVDRICKKHQIEYWLSSGTLIGALRHNGFIPWDDDLDIEMMRKDYLRFFYAKVRDRRSLMLENNGYDRMWKEQGIYIDIFPMEQHPIWLHKLTEKSFGHAYKIWRTSTDDNRSLRQVRRIFRFNKQLVYPLLRLLCKLLPDKTITSGMGIPFHNPRYAKDIFPLTTHQFEDKEFPVPYNADALLRRLYGDYMQLPDLSKLNLHVSKLEFYDD